MRKAGYDGAFWPSDLQEAILRAAALEPAAAVDAWLESRPMLTLDDLRDGESHRLLPLVYRNLRAQGVDDPDLPRLRGLYRRSWYDNQVRLHRIEPVLCQLNDAGVDTLLLKGVPLALQYYRDLGLRPMADVDVLVPYERFDAALDVLEADGWRDLGLDIPRGRRRRSYHGANMTHPDGQELDVHWQLSMPFVLPDAEGESSDDFWEASVPLTVGDLEVRALAPTDLLLHVMVHGTWYGSAATVRWAADAATVLRAGGDELDWKRLLDQTVRRRLVLPVRNALRYLVQVLAAPVPADALAAVEAAPVTAREHRTYLICGGTNDSHAVFGGLFETRAYWAHQSAKWSRVRAAYDFPFFLQDMWNLAHPWQVPMEVARKATRRLRDAWLRFLGTPRRDRFEPTRLQ